MTGLRWLPTMAMVVVGALAFLPLAASAGEAADAADKPTIITAPGASSLETLAAREVRRYVYLRTGQLLPTASQATAPAGSALIIARKDRAPVAATAALQSAVKDLGPQQYLLKTITVGGRPQVWLVGGDDIGTLYGAYRFAEHLGVRFYLHGDVVPDRRIGAAMLALNETGKPLFETRGIQPFHDFPEGPDWWNQDDYLAYIAQLPKMRMNFLGLHCYPEGGVGPEPGVWIGLPADLDPQGGVTFSYPAQWANTARDGMWGNAAMRTGEFCGGAAMLFDGDTFGPDVMHARPTPTTPEQCCQVFNATAAMFRVAFAQARALGVKTCIGTETPLTIPKLVQERLKQQGKDPKNLAAVREVYEGMFRRIAKACPVDYYWLWTPEDWTWGGNKPGQFEATVKDIQAALDALNAIGKPFTLATSGWVLGPQQDRAALDKCLPKECPMSCINQQVGHAADEPGFAHVHGRPKWVIPWMENDPNLTAPQPWVGRMRYDAADARRLGCTGLLGIHWRTKILAGNVAALASAGWDQSWVPAGFDPNSSPLPTAKPILDGVRGGSIAAFTASVSGADEQTVYQSVRYNVSGYDLKVPNGTYTVTLKFNEPFYREPGKRVFAASLQGKRVIDQLDVFAKVGQNKALDFQFPDIRVSDGWLKIHFENQVEYACIAGIVVQGKSTAGEAFVRKINCGGAKHRDYEADTVDHSPNPQRERTMPVEDFYVDFARASFGDAVAESIGKLLAKIDGVNLPEPTTWLNGPGGVKPESRPWTEIQKLYRFVDELATLRDRIEGAGNRDRFDYWLNTYRFMAALAHAGCLRGQLDQTAAALKAEKDSAKRRALATQALPVRIELAKVWQQMISLQVAAVDTPGELGTLANLEQHSRKQLAFLSLHDVALREALGSPLPPSVEPGKTYDGPARIVVPTVRTMAEKGELLKLRILAVDREPVRSVELHCRNLGQGQFRTTAAKCVGRAVYCVSLPPMADDLEYYVTAVTGSGKTIVWPATAPGLCQTVIVGPDRRAP